MQTLRPNVFADQAAHLLRRLDTELLVIACGDATGKALGGFVDGIRAIRRDARKLGQPAIGRLAQRMERLVSRAARGRLDADRRLLVLLLCCADRLVAHIRNVFGLSAEAGKYWYCDDADLTIGSQQCLGVA